MKSAMLFSLLGAVASFAGVNAVKLPKPLDVWSPKILTPNHNTIWTHGEKQNVTWDTSDAPKSISNGFSVHLRYDDLISPLILASGFDPLAGVVTVDVPWVWSGTYSIVLFGDSGNNSEDFIINE